MDATELAVNVPSTDEYPPVALAFPEAFCRDTDLFDDIVEALRIGSERGPPRRKVEAMIATEAQNYFRRTKGLGEAREFGSLYLQSRGQWGARHFDKVVFTLPIPRFNEKLARHRELAELSRQAEKIAAAVSLPEDVKFQRARRRVRDALAECGLSGRIDALVAKLLA
jgi:hypothetical protein